MKIYKISFDYLKFMNLSINKKKLMLAVGKGIGGSKAFMSYSWDNLSLKDAWIDQGGSFVQPEDLKITLKPDITTWTGASLVLSPRAYDLLIPKLDDYGEFLPITIDDEPFYIFNCRNVVEADKSQSEADIVDDLWMGVKSIGFTDDAVANNLIFKTRFDRCSTLYCGDEFKKLIDSLEFKGILFLENLVSEIN
jgi:hypothetical protein